MPHAWQSCIFDSFSRFVELFLAYNKQRLYFRSSPLLTAEFLRLTNEMQERTKSGAAPNARVLIGQALGAETRCALQFPHDKAKTVSFPRIIHTSITNPWIKLSLVRPYYTFLFSCMLYKLDPWKVFHIINQDNRIVYNVIRKQKKICCALFP